MASFVASGFSGGRTVIEHVEEQIAELRGKTGHVNLSECADTMQSLLDENEQLQNELQDKRAVIGSQLIIINRLRTTAKLKEPQ